ncbi:MAG: hypothetical protein RLZZ396_1196, partial [Planctomycetota bacterium]
MEVNVGLSRELREAIEQQDLSIVRIACRQSDLEWDEVDGTALHYTAYFGTREIAEYFVKSGIDINVRGGTYDATALTYAAEQGNIGVVKYLLELGAMIDLSHVLRNPLTRAAEEGHSEVVSHLLDAGADPHATYRIPTGKLINALSIAEDNGHPEVASILKSR